VEQAVEVRRKTAATWLTHDAAAAARVSLAAGDDMLSALYVRSATLYEMLSHWQPVQLAKQRLGAGTILCLENHASKNVLGTLEFVDRGCGCAGQQRVAIVEPRSCDAAGDCLGSLGRQHSANISEGASVVHARTGDGADVSVKPLMVVDDNAE